MFNVYVTTAKAALDKRIHEKYPNSKLNSKLNKTIIIYVHILLEKMRRTSDVIIYMLEYQTSPNIGSDPNLNLCVPGGIDIADMKYILALLMVLLPGGYMFTFRIQNTAEEDGGELKFTPNHCFIVLSIYLVWVNTLLCNLAYSQPELEANDIMLHGRFSTIYT